MVAQPTGGPQTDRERCLSISPTNTVIPAGRPEVPEDQELNDYDDYDMGEIEEPVCQEEAEALAATQKSKEEEKNNDDEQMERFI